MAKKEKLNEEAALNNNLSASTLLMNEDIKKEHKKPKAVDEQKRR
ncbi:hypothetical protein GCM10011351_30540 [Paraliobacillus quinghaiensis]|uniref:Uncharacterized protein n=1 Tax=Paraliobacillus quinghaiensis TaxID=470815 RepID=A0A917WXK4_9BACI|nr:hypothetical protein [Paraliobacillus quinghaiensis]GGM42420.1 hypothetical protein GCM10011351_30540 [Paraliobacillus quinghaiensis]